MEYFSFKDKLEKRETVILSLIVLAIAAILCCGIAEPWTGWFDFNGAAHSRFAKNFLTFGFLHTKFTPTWDLGSIVPERFDYYLHHPPLLSYMVAASFEVFGFYEWAARLIPVIFSVMAAGLFYLLVRLLWGKALALFSLVFFGFCPAFLYYGRMVNPEPVFLFFCLLIVYFYLRLLDARKKADVIGLAISFVFAYFTAWPAFYLSFILLAHYLIFGYKHIKDRRPIIVLGLMPVLFACFYISWIYLIKGSLNDNINAVISRFGPNQVHRFTSSEFLLLEISRAKTLFTRIIYLTLPLYACFLIRKGRESFLKNTVDIIFLSLAAINIFLFREGAWEHDYQLYYFLPFLAIASAKGVFLLRDYLRDKITFRMLASLCLIVFLSLSYRSFTSIRSFKFDIDRGMADKINSMTGAGEEIATNFKVSVPTAWYLDRRYRIIKDTADFQNLIRKRKISYVILMPAQTNSELTAYLDKKYPSFIYGKMIFYNLK